jgi:V8-like Glu-specific endopeptidase
VRRVTGALLVAAVVAVGGAVGCQQGSEAAQRVMDGTSWLAGAAWAGALRTAGDDGPQQELESTSAVRAQESLPEPAASPTADPLSEPDQVGALFAGGTQTCTASVVDSPGRDLLITAAHCIHGGKDGWYTPDITFVPGYQNGQRPYGTWSPQRMLVDPRWITAADPDLDVGFIVLKPLHGKHIQDFLGGDTIGVNQGFTNLVRVSGYPEGASQPVTCENWTSQQAAYQVRFDCAGMPDGTSGSPLITGYNPATGTGTIVGVIGGYQLGGDTSWVSYSPYFNRHVWTLYQQAIGG